MDIDDTKSLGSLVRAIRHEHGLSQSELAAQVGTTRQWLSRFEQGINDVSLAHAFAVLDALDVKLSYIGSALESKKADTQSPSSGRGPADTAGSRHQAPEGSETSTTTQSASGEVGKKDSSKSIWESLRDRDALASLDMRRGFKKATTQSAADVVALESEESPQRMHPASTPHTTSTGPGARYSIESDIQRIAQSSLFKKR